MRYVKLVCGLCILPFGLLLNVVGCGEPVMHAAFVLMNR